MTPTLAKIVAFGLFLAIGFAAVPLMLRLFVYGQRRIGNESVPMVRFLAEHQTGVVLAAWAVFALGLAVALPAMITDEFFGRPAKQALHGGKTAEADETYWLKGEALLHLEPKRVDDEQRGEDPRTAGRWMLAVSIFERTASGSYPRLDFGAP